MEPLRVLQINYAMDMGGAETLLMNLYRNIDRTRVQFDFLLHCPNESVYEKEILSLGGKIYKIPRYLGFNKISYERKLTEFLKAHPEHIIIHDHLMDSASETLRIAKRLGRITIAHSHAASAPFSLTDIYRFFFRRNLWKIADYRFACSNEAGKWLYRGKADFTILKNGIIIDRFKFSEKTREIKRKEFGIDNSTRIVGTIGRLVKEKNQIRLLEIMKNLISIDENSVLIIIGEGPLEHKLKSTTKILNLEDKVIFTGQRTDANELLMAMDCFVLPSLSEGFGIALIEAQATGLPCVFSDIIPKDVDLIPELIHRVSLSDSNETWTQTILNCRVLNNKENAWKDVARNGYDIRNSSEQLQNFYLGLLEKKCASV